MTLSTFFPFTSKALFLFFYDPGFLEAGVSWIFSCGGFSRIGVARYTCGRKLIGELDSFLESFELMRRKLHGGFFCYCFKEPVVEDIIVVGCAQEQTLPLTGEGIGRCITHGRRCGQILQRVLDGQIDLKEARKEFMRVFLGAARAYPFLLGLQNRFLNASERRIEMIVRIISIKWISKWQEKWYRKI
jgi:flavin-dependent dehydrogenase